MQHGHDDLGRGHAFFLVDVDRNAATVVGHRYRAVVVDLHDHIVGVPRQGFVDRIVDDFEHHVMQAGAVMHVADVHAGALADRFQSPEDSDFAGIVIAVRCRNRFVGHSLRGRLHSRWCRSGERRAGTQAIGIRGEIIASRGTPALVR